MPVTGSAQLMLSAANAVPIGRNRASGKFKCGRKGKQEPSYEKTLQSAYPAYNITQHDINGVSINRSCGRERI